jgi:hypothetical protein
MTGLHGTSSTLLASTTSSCRSPGIESLQTLAQAYRDGLRADPVEGHRLARLQEAVISPHGWSGGEGATSARTRLLLVALAVAQNRRCVAAG